MAVTSPRSIACFCALLIWALAPVAAAQSPPGGWQAVLVAGDNAQPVFDNATAALQRFLISAGVAAENIHRLSANVDASDPSVEPATADRILRRIAGLRPRPGERCLVFITSHGQQAEGLYLARSGEVLQPAMLAGALSAGCGAAPTVAILSGCYSGSCAAYPMRAPNRVILTAARADRPSFGCQADRTYTFYDQCLLAVLPRGGSWHNVYRDTSACVASSEKSLGAAPSQPQAWFGKAVAKLTLR
jgi:hypothetical protein